MGYSFTYRPATGSQPAKRNKKECLRSRILLAVLVQLFALSCFGVHIKGGWMYYEHMGTAADGSNTYRIVVKVYRDCAPPNAGQNDERINITIFNNNTVTLEADVISPQSNLYPLEKQSFSECINPRPNVCYRVLEYTGSVVLPPNGNGYTAAFQRCCRINGIVNTLQPSDIFGNSYTITIPGTINGAGNPVNNSPRFVEKDTVAVCYNSPIELDYSATDPDGDSLVYSFTSALDGGSQTMPAPPRATTPPYNMISYAGGFSQDNPFGTGTVIDPKTGIITGMSPSVTGEYVLAVSIKEYRNGLFLAETRKELHVNVAPCSIASAELPIRITTCDGFNVQFENLSISPNIHTYHWDFGVPGIDTDTSSLPRPEYTYTDTGVYTAKLVVNNGEPCTDSASTQVRVFPGFFPDFNADGSCFSNPVVFTNTSRTNYGSINYARWNFGDLATLADTSLLLTSQYRYPQPGFYTVFLETASDKGCSDTLSKIIEVLDRPALTVAFPDTLICTIDSLQLRAIGTGSFSWQPTTNMIGAGTATPIVFPKDTTTYIVTLNDRGCIATQQVRVNTLDFITVDAGPDTTICLTDTVRLRPVTHALNFAWTPAATLDDPNLKNPLATPTASSTTYRILANLGKCQATDMVTIRTVPYPQAANTDTAICFADTAMLVGSAVGTRYLWEPSNLVGNPTALSTPAYPAATTPFTLYVYDTLGCPKPGTATMQVMVRPRIEVFAGNDTMIVIGQPVQLSGITNGTIYNWTPTTGLDNATVANPVVTINSMPASGGQLRYVLTATTPEGCKATDDIVLRIFTTGPSIFIPNAFTPNADGKNDSFKPTLAGMRQLDFFRIYNRYGQLIFETSQIGRGWDGRVNGQLQNANAFVYHCQAVDYTGKTVRLSGTFVLVR